jgi:predicted ferric reductase
MRNTLSGLAWVVLYLFFCLAAPFGIDALLRYHVQITFVGLAFALAHPALLFVADSRYLPLLNLLTAPRRARFAFTSVIALLVLVGLSVWRSALHLSYELWHATHGLLAVIVVLFALLHASLVGYCVTGLPRHVVYDGYVGGLIFLLVWIRFISPLIRPRHPWRVVRVVAQRGDTSTALFIP